ADPDPQVPLVQVRTEVTADGKPAGRVHYLAAEHNVFVGDLLSVLTELVPARLRQDGVQELPGGLFVHGPHQGSDQLWAAQRMPVYGRWDKLFVHVTDDGR